MTQKKIKFDDLEPIQDEPTLEALEPVLDDLEPVEEAAESRPAPAPAPKPKPAPAAKPAPAPAAKPAPAPAAKPAPAPAPKPKPAAVAKPAVAASGAGEASLEPEKIVAPGVAAPVAKPVAKPVVRPSARKRGGSGEAAAAKEKKARGAPPAKPGTQSRELEQAPKLLKTAALILIVACLMPWMHVEALTLDPAMSFAAKGLILFGTYVFYQGLRQSYGDSAAGFAQKLDIKVIPARGKSFGWSVGEILGIVLLLVGLLPILDVAAFPTGNFLLKTGVSAYGDKGMLALGCLTITHIYAYSKGAHFNPLFPMMFLGPAIAGLTTFLGFFAGSRGWWTVGALGASAAGLLAVYTIAVALKQAKIEGDAKRAAQAEARRSSRKKSS